MSKKLQIGLPVEVFTLSFGVVARGVITKIEGEKIFIKNGQNKEAWYYAKNVHEDLRK